MDYRYCPLVLVYLVLRQVSPLCSKFIRGTVLLWSGLPSGELSSSLVGGTQLLGPWPGLLTWSKLSSKTVVSAAAKSWCLATVFEPSAHMSPLFSDLRRCHLQ